MVSASLSILIVAHSPHGLNEIHRLMSSSIIGATRSDVWLFAVLGVCTALGIGVSLQRILLFTMDPAMAAAVGIKVAWMATFMSAWLGLAVGLSIRVSGML